MNKEFNCLTSLAQSRSNESNNMYPWFYYLLHPPYNQLDLQCIVLLPALMHRWQILERLLCNEVESKNYQSRYHQTWDILWHLWITYPFLVSQNISILLWKSMLHKDVVSWLNKTLVMESLWIKWYHHKFEHFLSSIFI